MATLPPTSPGYPGQLQEVTPFTITDSSVPRRHLPLGLSSPFPSRGEGVEDRYPVPGHDSQSTPLSPATGMLSGRSQLRLLLRPSGPSSSQADNQLDEHSHFGSVQGSSRSSGLVTQGASPSLDRRVVPTHSGSYVRATSITPTHDRRFQVGLGRGSDPLFSLRDVASLLSLLFRQLARAPGRPTFGPSLSPSTTGEMCAAPYRQYDGSGLHTSPRYSPLSSPYGPVKGSPRVLLRSLCHSGPQTPQWCPERSGGPGIPLGAGLDGVVSGRGDVRLGGLQIRPTTGGLVCHQGESPASSLCVTLPRPGRGGDERLLGSLGQVGVHLPIPSGSSSSEGVLPSSVSGQGSLDCALLCSVKLAPQPSSQISKSHSSSIRSFSVAEDQQRAGFSPPALRLLPSRVETIRMGLLAAGFDDEAADYLQSQSTS